MLFTQDKYKRLAQSKLFLANPQKNYIGVLSGAEELYLTANLHTISELTFKIYEYVDGKKNKYYDKVEQKRLIELQYISWFQIEDVKEYPDGELSYKEIKCLSLENELTGKRVDDLNGVFALHDVVDTDHSLLHILTRNSGWKIGHVSNELLSKYRTFSINTAKIYNVLTTDIAKSFQCQFIFNTFEKEIHAYTLDEVGELTDIIISRNNIMSECIKEGSANNIVTKLKVLGADGVDIRSVNPNGSNYLINVDYFKTTEWMSQSLIDALNVYQTKFNNYMSQYNTTLSLLKQRQSELTVLQTQLKDLESNKKSQDNVVGTYIEMYNGTPPSESAEYTSYINALNYSNSYITQIYNKNAEIGAKKTQINTVQSNLDNIGVDLDTNNNFTQSQIDELNVFLTENEEYQDSTFVASDSMSQEEVTEMKLELMQNGANELARASQPQYTINVTANNIFSMYDGNNIISYSKFKEKLALGNMITVKYRDDYMTTARLLTLGFDFQNLADIKLTFSDKSRFDSSTSQLGDILSKANNSSQSLSLSKIGWDQASKLTNPVRDFMNGSLDATLNKMVNNKNKVETEIGEFGIINREWLEDQNKYSPYMSWWNQNTLLFSSDGMKSAKAGIGQFTTPQGEKFYGVLADVIIGNFMLTSALTVSNESNTITMNKDGAKFQDCDITITKGTNILKLNATDGIKLTKNGVSQFYLDANGDATFGGKLSAVEGTFKGQITGGSMNINDNFIVDSLGNATLKSATLGGNINLSTASSITWGNNNPTKDLNIPVLPNYIQSGYIDSTIIKSPNIQTNMLRILTPEIDFTQSGFALNGYYQQYGVYADMFYIKYYNKDIPYINIGTEFGAVVDWNLSINFQEPCSFYNLTTFYSTDISFYNSNVDFNGSTVDFRNASVLGLTAKFA